MVRRELFLFVLFLFCLTSCSSDGSSTIISSIVSTPSTISLTNYSYDKRFKKILDDFPSIGGSYAVEPLWWVIICKMYNIECKWQNNEYHPVYSSPNAMELSNYIYYKYQNGGSEELFQSLIDNKIDIVISTRAPLNYEESHQLIPSTKLKYEPIAIDSLVIVENSINPVDSLTINNVRDIYSGIITNWKEVGGNNQTINLYQQELPYGSEDLFDTLVMEPEQRIEGKEIIEVSNKVGLVCKMLYPFFDKDALGDRSGIGYSLRFLLRSFIGNELKQLNINNIPPTTYMIEERKYPFYVEIYIVMRKDDVKESTNQLYTYLTSDLFQDTGLFLSPYLPAK
jgi:ABC-type phosphate transport system substrate-binding protein